MKRILPALCTVLTLGVHSPASALDLRADAGKILGTYAGGLELDTIKGPVHFDYSVRIFDLDAANRTLSLKIRCDKCKKKRLTLRGCAITDVDRSMRFMCKGDDWQVDYELAEGKLRGKGLHKNGRAYSVRVAKTEEPSNGQEDK